jgi:hypothetical protein
VSSASADLCLEIRLSWYLGNVATSNTVRIPAAAIRAALGPAQ